MNKEQLESTKRNYFIIGSVLTFFVVGGMTLYAKTGGDMNSVTQLLGIEDSSRSGLEQEVEVEHGVVTTFTKPHGGDDSDDSSDDGDRQSGSTDDDGASDQGKGDDDSDSDDDGEHRGRGSDDDDEDGDDDHRSGQSGSGSGGSVTPSPVVTSPVPVAPTAKTFTMAEVATHANAQSCYTTISGNVYDVTAYVPIHTGGSAQILAICGKDGSSLFSGQHAGEPKPAQALASFKIGALAQ